MARGATVRQSSSTRSGGQQLTVERRATLRDDDPRPRVADLRERVGKLHPTRAGGDELSDRFEGATTVAGTSAVVTISGGISAAVNSSQLGSRSRLEVTIASRGTSACPEPRVAPRRCSGVRGGP